MGTGKKNTWQRAMRPMSTVIMDKQVQNDLFGDMKDFLSKATQQWYADKGLAYQRGYLLFGPSRTAGEVEMNIYTLQLTGLSDSQLTTLFAQLPPHCMVLLEDVDAAGMGSRDTADQNQTKESSFEVTISGLLKALDGVASPDDRVLIMTTNHIKKLDEALIIRIRRKRLGIVGH
ncbi:hypothetical protein N7462_006923 [Penicillium macrosclerotiorum]|uniref:uncharacterized protein n=1 Tax=Penicillium macrosclerotiorum TaxID=303699 RepID=UPI00254843BB|nr:uncharacterized protein N7462_006923 [Penicillium macrosclerotiorum]KAJ5678679.1 hypothetical protein N7462_006923 [Penicillium macrosclerotiorum]